MCGGYGGLWAPPTAPTAPTAPRGDPRARAHSERSGNAFWRPSFGTFQRSCQLSLTIATAESRTWCWQRGALPRTSETRRAAAVPSPEQATAGRMEPARSPPLDSNETLRFTPDRIISRRLPGTNGELRTKATFRRGPLLGRGSFGRAYLLTALESEASSPVASKVLLKGTVDETKLQAEIDLHRRLHHRHIVACLDTFDDDSHVHLLLELCDGSALQLLRSHGPLSISHATRLITQAASGLLYLHETHRVIHRDIKPQNLLLKQRPDEQGGGEVWDLKIADFGLSARLTSVQERRHTICGTVNYMAPEIIRQKGGYSFPVDAWALGAVFYMLMCGRAPFAPRRRDIAAAAMAAATAAATTAAVAAAVAPTPTEVAATADVAGDATVRPDEIIDAIGEGQPGPSHATRPEVQEVAAPDQLPEQQPAEEPEVSARAARKLVFRKILKGDYTLPSSVQSEALTADLLATLLCLDATARATMRDVLGHACCAEVEAGASMEAQHEAQAEATDETQCPLRNVMEAAHDVATLREDDLPPLPEPERAPPLEVPPGLPPPIPVPPPPLSLSLPPLSPPLPPISVPPPPPAPDHPTLPARLVAAPSVPPSPPLPPPPALLTDPPPIPPPPEHLIPPPLPPTPLSTAPPPLPLPPPLESSPHPPQPPQPPQPSQLPLQHEGGSSSWTPPMVRPREAQEHPPAVERPRPFRPRRLEEEAEALELVDDQETAIGNDEGFVASAPAAWDPRACALRLLDFSADYGIGFTTSTGCVGAAFNDGSSLVLSADLSYYEYCAKALTGSLERGGMASGMPLALSKKMKLLQCFQATMGQRGGTPCQAALLYASGSPHGTAAACARASEHSSAAASASALTRVTRWRRTRHALVCEFDGELLQAVFVDGSEILLAPDSAVLVWVSRQGDPVCLPLGSEWPNVSSSTGSSSIDKRLRYVTELLQRWRTKDDSALQPCA